jgi:hypothetical protein
VETLQLTDTDVVTSRKRKYFWRRQFRSEITTQQIVFDVTLGAMAPLVCFVVDPIVFRAAGFGPPLLPAYQTFTYLFSGAEIAVLCLWLIIRPQHHVGSRIIAGALLGGAVFCAAMGFVLSPFSLLGLMFGIGIFGFTPFLTAFVYARNVVRAFRSGDTTPVFESGMIFTGGFLLATILPLTLSMAIHSAVTNSVDEVIHGDAQHASFAAQRLIPLRFFDEAELNRIGDAYLAEQNPQKREQLRALYLQITGDDLDVRMRLLRD